MEDPTEIIKMSGYCNRTLNEMAIDSLKDCLSKKHFVNYKKDITYVFNKHGHRDEEWPTDLSDVIWCLGDSATLGIGQPFEETWPRVLQKKVGKRCINIATAGCSNDTIRLRAQFISKTFAPKTMVVMWSHLNRRRTNDIDVQYDENDFGDEADTENFLQNFKTVNDLPIQIIHTIFPKALNNNIKDVIDSETKHCIIHFDKLDLARDFYHFDIKTSEHVVDRIHDKIRKL